MGMGELLLAALGLSMDAFAVSICKGLAAQEPGPRHGLLAGLYFGSFQALMPLLGWLLGSRFAGLIARVDHWIAFLLLGLIGGNMIRGAFSREETQNGDFGAGTMLLLALATSIDALAVGVTFAFLAVPILPAAALIGGTAFLLSAAGVFLGRAVGGRGRAGAEAAGGAALILIGLKILLEHLGLWSF